MKALVPVLLMTFAMMTATPAAMAGSETTAGMQDMDATMQRIRATEDPVERERLLEQHLDQMHAEMELMHKKMGDMMDQMKAQRKETKRLHDHRKTKH